MPIELKIENGPYCSQFSRVNCISCLQISKCQQSDRFRFKLMNYLCCPAIAQPIRKQNYIFIPMIWIDQDNITKSGCEWHTNDIPSKKITKADLFKFWNFDRCFCLLRWNTFYTRFYLWINSTAKSQPNQKMLDKRRKKSAYQLNKWANTWQKCSC